MSIDNSLSAHIASAQAKARQALLQHAGRGQKLAIYALLLQLALLPGTVGLPLPRDVMLYGYCLAFVLAVFAIFLMARGLRFHSLKTFISVIAQFIPLFNLLVLLYLVIQAGLALRQAGFVVGILGVKGMASKPQA